MIKLIHLVLSRTGKHNEELKFKYDELVFKPKTTYGFTLYNLTFCKATKHCATDVNDAGEPSVTSIGLDISSN